jgi:dienelactone hydrolase
MMRCGRRLTGWLVPLLTAAVLLLARGGALAAGRRQPPALERLLPGVWRGVQTKGYTTFHYRLEVRREGDGYVADGIAWAAMTEAQARAALNGQLSPDLFPNLRTNAVRPACLEQHFTVSLKDDAVTFRAAPPTKTVRMLLLIYVDAAGKQGQETSTAITRLEPKDGPPAIETLDTAAGRVKREGKERDMLLTHFAEFTPDLFEGRLTEPGVVAQDGPDKPQENGFFRLWREDALATPQPLDKAKGSVLKIACQDGTRYHYACYLPKSYDPGKPSPVVINAAPDGNAQPLSERAAESLGWIMVGLTEAENGSMEINCRNRDAVLFDLRRRFNIDMKHIYFAGFSGGARFASLSAQSYPDNCAGLFCIGASCQGAVPPLPIPIYFLTGTTDVNRAEVTRVFTAERRAGRKTELATHPGGHSWGVSEDHEEALRWLAQQSAPSAETH